MEGSQPRLCTCGLVGLALQAHTHTGHIALLTDLFLEVLCVHICVHTRLCLLVRSLFDLRASV